MFSFDEFPAIDVVKSGKNGSFGVAGIGDCGSSAQLGSGSGSRSAYVGRDNSHVVHGVGDKLQVVRFEKNQDIVGVGGVGTVGIGGSDRRHKEHTEQVRSHV